MQIRREIYWPTTVYYVDNSEHGAIKAGLVELCYELRNRGSVSAVSPHVKPRVYESEFVDAHFLQEERASGLRRFLDSATEQALDRPLDIYESWCHITNDYGYHDRHEHAECHWAGIYYVQTSECSFATKNGLNCLYSPLDSAAKHLHPDVIVPEATEGRLLLFPNYLKHSALPYHGAEDRIVVAFNARCVARRAEGDEAQHAGGRIALVGL